MNGRKHRRLKNFLLDSHFQLKYTSYLLAIAIVLSLALGALLWSVSREVMAQSQETLRRGQETVRQGQEVVRESQKVSAVVRMNIVKDPAYAGNPELAAVFNEGAEEQGRKLASQQRGLEAEAIALEARAASLVVQQRRMFLVLVAALSVLVLFIGLAGIVVTHKVAGPIYKMKRLIEHVGEGHLNLHEKLRKGDELVHFFDAFDAMVEHLRQRQESEIRQIDSVVSGLEGKATPEQLAALGALRAEMQTMLELPPSPPRPARSP
jgi:hypothetical protein